MKMYPIPMQKSSTNALTTDFRASLENVVAVAEDVFDVVFVPVVAADETLETSCEKEGSVTPAFEQRVTA